MSKRKPSQGREVVMSDEANLYTLPEEVVSRITELEAANAALERESFALAANQCHGGYAGEYGHHRCRYQDRITELEAQLAEAREVLKEIAVAADIAADTENKHIAVWIADRAYKALKGLGGE